MKRIISLWFAVLCSILVVDAQHTFQKVIGEANRDETATAIVESSSGDFYVVGTAEYTGKGKEVVLMKLNGTGDLLWTKSYGVSPNNSAFRFDDIANRLVLSKDGQKLFIIGRTEKVNTAVTPNTQVNSQALVISVQLNGTLNWMKRYGVQGTNTNRGITAVEVNTELWVFGHHFIGAQVNSSMFRVNSGTGQLPLGNNSRSWNYSTNSNIRDMGLGAVVEHATGISALGSHNLNVRWTEIISTGSTVFTTGKSTVFGFAQDSRLRNAIVDANDHILGTGFTHVDLATRNGDALFVKFNPVSSLLNISANYIRSIGTAAGNEEGVGLVENMGETFLCGNRVLNGTRSVFLTKLSSTGIPQKTVELIPNGFLNKKSNCILYSSDGRILVVGTKNTATSQDMFIQAIDPNLEYDCSLPELTFSSSLPTYNAVNTASQTDYLPALNPLNLIEGSSLSYDCDLICSSLYAEEDYKEKCPNEDMILDSWSYVNLSLYTPWALTYEWYYNDPVLGWTLVSNSRYYTIVGPQQQFSNLYKLVITHEDGCKADQLIRVDDIQFELPNFNLVDLMCLDDLPGGRASIPQHILDHLLNNWSPNGQEVQGIIIDWGDPNSVSSLSIGDLASYLQNNGDLSHYYPESGDYTVTITVVTPCGPVTFQSNTFKVRYNPKVVLSQSGDCPNLTLKAFVMNQTGWALQDLYFEWYNGSTTYLSGFGEDEYALSVYCEENICVRVTTPAPENCVGEVCTVLKCEPEVTLTADKLCGTVTLTANLTLADPSTATFSWYDYDVSTTTPVAQGLGMTQFIVFNPCYKKVKVVVTPGAPYDDCPTEAEIELKCDSELPPVEFVCENGEVLVKILPDATLLDDYAGISNIQVFKWMYSVDRNLQPHVEIYNGPLSGTHEFNIYDCGWIIEVVYTICKDGVYTTISVDYHIPLHVIEECCPYMLEPLERRRPVLEDTEEPNWEFQIYPNPAHSDLTIELDEAYGTAKVLTIEGKVVLEDIALVKGKNTFDVSKLSNGTYLVKVTSIKGVQVQRIIIE